MLKWRLLVVIVLTGYWSMAQDMKRFEFSEPKMGTPFRIIVYAADSTQVLSAVQETFGRIDRINEIMSDYDPGSELNQLVNKAASNTALFYPVSNDLWDVLQLAQEVSRRSKGGFDVTVGPLSKLWRRAFRRQVFPSNRAIQQGRSLVNYRWLKLHSQNQSVRLKKAGMRLDLGGIAKGYAVDAAYAVLQAHGFDQALVDGGGDIYAGKPPPGEIGWRVSRKFLRGDSLVNEIIYLKNKAIATSGDTYRFLEWQGKRYAHLINPKTGMGMTDRRMVMVSAPNCMLADAMASTFSVVPISKLKPIARRFDVTFEVIFRRDNDEWEQSRNDF